MSPHMSSFGTERRPRCTVAKRLGVAVATVAAMSAAAPAISQAQPTNLALNASGSGTPSPLESDPGWGGGSYPWDLTDGRRSYDTWARGLAFTGGRSNWAGQPCGPRQATIAFGENKTFDKIVLWQHGAQHVPATAHVAYWANSAWHEVSFTRNYGAVTEDGTNSGYAISDEYSFDAVTGSKVRWSLNNCENTLDPTIGQLEHGWIYEFEVFRAGGTSASSDSTVTATVGSYLAMSGGAATFSSIVPTIAASSYTSSASLQVTTSNPSGVAISVAPSTSVEEFGIPGASVWTAPSASPASFARLQAPGVNVVSASGPVNRTYAIPFRLDLVPGTVLRAGDTYTQPITYTATATLP